MKIVLTNHLFEQARSRFTELKPLTRYELNKLVHTEIEEAIAEGRMSMSRRSWMGQKRGKAPFGRRFCWPESRRRVYVIHRVSTTETRVLTVMRPVSEPP